MSYDISVTRNGEPVTFDRPLDIRGGTYAAGGTTTAWLNITYNYSKFYYEILGEKGIRSLYGKTVRECLPILEDAVQKLGTERASDYWAATRGNAGAALDDLLTMLYHCPADAIVEGD